MLQTLFMLKESLLMLLKEKLLVIFFIPTLLLSYYLDIFRPYPGYKSVRLIPKEKKTGEKLIFCFADFENVFQSTLVINTLQVFHFFNF